MTEYCGSDDPRRTGPFDADAADRAIDRAVREIMSAEPPAGFRHRVMRRLVDPEPASSWAAWSRLGLTAAALATILAVAIWLRPIDRHVEPVPVASAPHSPAPVTAQPPPQRDTEVRRAPPALVPPGTRTREIVKPAAPIDRIVSAASLPSEDIASFDERAESASARPDAVPAASPQNAPLPALAPPALSIPEIVLERIVIDDIAVAPIPAGVR